LPRCVLASLSLCVEILLPFCMVLAKRLVPPANRPIAVGSVHSK
jgi:hypothetical protein